MIKKYLLSFGCFLCCFVTFSQKQAHTWYMGENLGLVFGDNQANPTLIDYPISNHLWGSNPASISDTNGNLVLLVAGSRIFNKNLELIDDLNYLCKGRSIIIPQPNQANRYYVFMTLVSHLYVTENALSYYVVDISANGGKGKVVEKREIMVDNIGDKIAAIRHANGKDYWIMTHQLNSDKFIAYLLTEQGIQNQVVTKIGSTHNDRHADGSNFSGTRGQMKFSPSGDRLALTNAINGSIELFDFDKQTGGLSCVQSLSYKNEKLDAWGIEFSSNGRFLYFSTATNEIAFLVNPSSYRTILYQIDLEDNSFQPEVIYERSNSLLIGRDMQIAPNGKIYVTGVLHQITDKWFLHSIENPNVKGKDCNFVYNSIELYGRVGNQYYFEKLPTFVYNFLPNEAPTNTAPEILPLEMPNAFTPNGDNINDKFVPISYPYNLSSASLSIYNAWGKLVYTTDDLLAGWDGGKLPEGTYYYFIQYTTETQTSGTRCSPVFTTSSSETQKGWVKLLR